MAGVTLKDIWKIYPGDVVAVKQFNLEVQDKEFVVLVGPSGCGKTTTLRMIAGLEDISEGEMYIGDRLVNKVPAKDRDIAMVFQNYALYPHMTVFKNMAFSLELRKTPKEEIKQRVRETAKVLGIEHLLDRKPKALSGGERQRVALGRAMVRNPAVFLLDEPLSNLDAKLRATMRTELIQLHQRLEATFVYVTHDQTEAMTMGDRIVVMDKGVIQQVDTPQTLYDSPINSFVAGFIGTPQMNFVTGTLHREEGRWYFDTGTDRLPIHKEKDTQVLAAYDGRPVSMGIRPEDIEDDPAYVAANPEGVISAAVEVSELMGSEVYLYLGYNGSRLVARVPPDTGSRTGTRVQVALNTAKMHLFDPDTGAAILH